jgi:hypothetical protein
MEAETSSQRQIVDSLHPPTKLEYIARCRKREQKIVTLHQELITSFHSQILQAMLKLAETSKAR